MKLISFGIISEKQRDGKGTDVDFLNERVGDIVALFGRYVGSPIQYGSWPSLVLPAPRTAFFS
jgi:hypothetical protein